MPQNCRRLSIILAETYINYFVLLRLTMESVTIKLDPILAREMEKAMKSGYSTKTEFIREAIRHRLQELKIDYELRKYLGFIKKKTTYAEERRIRDQVGKEIMKEHGLDLE